MIRAAIFDIGNVLLKFNYSVAAERLRLRNGLPDLPDREFIVDARNRLESGHLPPSEFTLLLMDAFCHEGDQESFLEIWRDIFHPNQPMVDFARSISERMPVYLLSNISCIHRDFIFHRYDFFSIFHDGAYSYELGCLKPDPLIYHRTLKKFGLLPEEVVLFDDLEANVASAKNLGWQAFQYDFRRHETFLDKVSFLGLTTL